MRELFKKVSRSVSILLLAVSLLTAAGCGKESADVSADTEVSAFFIGKTEAKEKQKTDDKQKADDKREAEDELTVQFLDVGQGSAALIRQGSSSMLVDGGDREYSSYVVSFLKQQGITSLDYVVVSHYDSDHLSGIVGVLNAFECQQVLAPDYETDTRIYQSFRDVIREKKISVEYPRLGDTFSFGDSSFRVVSPASYTYEDANSNSLGIRLEYGKNSFLLCGDCTEESEQDLLYLGTELKSDVYAANHHGSKYSNSQEFLEAVSPSSVVISCGRGNSYGHPDAPVMLSIQNLGAALYRTDLQGVITAVSDGESIRFENEVCMDYRSGAETASGKEAHEAAELSGKESQAEAADGGEATYRYIININTKKFHLPGCSSAADMEDKNKEYSAESREELIEEGYSPCKRCNP